MNSRRASLLTSILCSPLRQSTVPSRLPIDQTFWLYHARQYHNSTSDITSSIGRLRSKWKTNTLRNIQSSRCVTSQSDDAGSYRPPDSTTSQHPRIDRAESVSMKIDGLVSKVTDRSRQILNDWTGYALVESLNKATEEQSRPLNPCTAIVSCVLYLPWSS